MLTIQDCIDMCRLTEEEIAAVAEHEHVPDTIALKMMLTERHSARRPTARSLTPSSRHTLRKKRRFADSVSRGPSMRSISSTLAIPIRRWRPSWIVPEADLEDPQMQRTKETRGRACR